MNGGRGCDLLLCAGNGSLVNIVPYFGITTFSGPYFLWPKRVVICILLVTVKKLILYCVLFRTLVVKNYEMEFVSLFPCLRWAHTTTNEIGLLVTARVIFSWKN